MRRTIKIFSLTILTLILTFVYGHTAKALENNWYINKAEAANNPILNDVSYYEGVSLTSSVISDLTYLEIPFEKYLRGDVKQLQVITFTEALYYQDDLLKNEVVMYLYVPSVFNNKLESVITDISIMEQQALVSGEMRNLYDKVGIPYSYRWQKMDSYGTIYKFSIPRYNNKDCPDSLKNNLLRRYTYEGHNVFVTTFNCNVSTLYFSKWTANYSENYSNYWISNQEFKYFYEIENRTRNGDNSYNNGVIAYNTGTARTEGVSQRLRFFTADLPKTSLLKSLLTSTSYNGEEYTDYFFHFFNVYDSNTGKKWSGNEILKKVNYTYYEYLTYYGKSENNNSDSGSSYIVSYRYPNGYDYIQDSVAFGADGIADFSQIYKDTKPYPTLIQTSYNEQGYDAEGNFGGNTPYSFENIIYRQDSELVEIYQKGVVEPGTIKNKFPINNNYNNWVTWLGGAYEKAEVTLPTLFRTDDPDLVNDMNYNLMSGEKISDYQFGLMFGDTNGYSAFGSERESWWFFSNSKDSEFSQYTAHLVSIDSIEYEYQGETYIVSVSESKIDNTNINIPDVQDPGNEDGNNLFPNVNIGLDGNLSWWQKVARFFKNIFSSNGLKNTGKFLLRLLLVVGVTLVTIIGIKYLIKFIIRVIFKRNNDEKKE